MEICSPEERVQMKVDLSNLKAKMAEKASEAKAEKEKTKMRKDLKTLKEKRAFVIADK